MTDTERATVRAPIPRRPTRRQHKSQSGSTKAIYAALIGNCLVAATKFFAATMTGSASMFSEGVHSLVDTGNELLLLYGMHRARQRPDDSRPFGYGRESYFWSFIVALLVFALGSGVALFQGVVHILHPVQIEDAYVNYIVLGLAFLFEGSSWWISVRQVRREKGRLGYFEAFRQSKDPTIFVVLFEDSAALVGIVVAFGGIWGATAFGMPMLDGSASVIISLVLAFTATLLARETKSLLIGEPADPKLVRALAALISEDADILKVNGIITAHIGPSQIMAAASLEFADALGTADIERKVADMEDRIHEIHPDVVALFVKPQTPARFEKSRQRRISFPPLP